MRLFLGLVIVFVGFRSDAKTERLPYLRVGSFEKLETCGFGIKVFKDAKNIPVMAVEAKVLVGRRGNETVRVNVYPSTEYWLREQFIARWECPGGRILVHEMTLPVPVDLPNLAKDHVTSDAFEKWASNATFSGFEAAEGWIKKAFGDGFSVGKTSIRGQASTVWKCDEGKTSGEQPYREVYLVEAPRKLGRYFVVTYELDSKRVDVSNSLKTILASIKSTSIYAVRASDNSTSLPTANKEVGSDLENGRKKVIDSIANLPKWWHLETKNYVLLSNVKNRRTIVAVQNDIELCRNSFETCLPLLKPITAVSAVRLFQDRNEYLAYVGKENETTAGLWMPGKKELVVSPMERPSAKEQRTLTVQVLYHEGFHQYLFYACGEKQSNVWFNEGHATFFEGLKLGRTRFEVDLVDHYAKQMSVLAKSGVPLERFITMSYDEFYGGDLRTVQARYSVVYGLVYFLNKGSTALRTKNSYWEIPLKYYKTLAETGDRDKASKVAWENVDIAQFSKDFHMFWTDPKLIQKSERYRYASSRKDMFSKLEMVPANKK